MFVDPSWLPWKAAFHVSNQARVKRRRYQQNNILRNNLKIIAIPSSKISEPFNTRFCGDPANEWRDLNLTKIHHTWVIHFFASGTWWLEFSFYDISVFMSLKTRNYYWKFIKRKRKSSWIANSETDDLFINSSKKSLRKSIPQKRSALLQFSWYSFTEWCTLPEIAW